MAEGEAGGSYAASGRRRIRVCEFSD